MALKENYMRPNPWINQFNEEPKQVDYEDDRIGRLLEITNNLEKFYNENPDLFANEEEFKKNFHFDERSPMQKTLLEGFWKNNEMQKTKPEDTNSDIFWDTAGEAETSPDKWTERDALVWWGSVAEEPKKPETPTLPETKKTDAEKAQENIDKWTKYQTTIQEWKADDMKAKADKKRVNVKDWLAWLKG